MFTEFETTLALPFEVDRRSSSSGGDLILFATDGREGEGRVINACIRKLLPECVFSCIEVVNVHTMCEESTN